ncbi:hypothetical protein D187_008727 [Cystobacter fuscus DSM 2262]|uniref:Phage portal protein n=1 Tax=Cystobacter fuscus (strain ATCC 25194 / DSM 2262 / NBRC 100088 / M29) TaxID=1242864 RepID=S9QMQ1_CYSF2|nr:phage portal protein [Cystobacter fuscus]EPX62539.1 hypothetical protein D187_008727 [Cystobacter fuscus DSM 2262]
MARPSFGTRFKAALAGFLLPGSGRPLVHGIPINPFTPRRGSRAVCSAYRTNGWLRAVADTVAESVATPRWRVLKATTPKGKALLATCKRLSTEARTRTGALERHQVQAKGLARGDLVELDTHELLTLLEHPHPDFTGRSLRKVQQLHLDLPGESFLWLRRSTFGSVVGYEVVPPACVLQTPTQTGAGYLVVYNNFSGMVPRSEMVWLRHLDPDNLHARGVGRGLALGDELDASEAIQQTLKSTFERGGLPAAIVGVDGGTAGDGEDEVEDLRAKYEERFSGPDSAGLVWFVNGKTTLSQVQQDFRALQLVEAEKSLRDYVRQVYNVPPELVGDLTSANRSTSEEAKYTLAEYATLPRLEFLRTEYQLHLVPLVDRDAVLDYDDPRPHSWERRLKAMTSAYGPHVFMNEARELAGQAPDPKLNGMRFQPLPGAQPVQDGPKEPHNEPPPRGPAKG